MWHQGGQAQCAKWNKWVHQVINAMVNAWEENPWNPEAFFMVPHVFPKQVVALTQMVEVQTFAAAGIQDYGNTMDVPCLLLYFLCYINCFPQSDVALQLSKAQ